MTSEEAGDHLAILLGRMDALLVRLEEAVARMSSGVGTSGGPSDAVDTKAYEELVKRLKLEQQTGESVPIAD